MQMFKCDWEGKGYEGSPANKVQVDFDAETRLEVKLLVKREGRYVEGDLGPAAVSVIQAAIEPQKQAYLAHKADLAK